MNLYIKIKSLLEQDSKYRNSDKELIWRIWEDEGQVVNNFMTKTQFMESTLPETIRRTRQKVIEAHPELDASGIVKEKRVEQEKIGGNHVFNSAKKNYDQQFIKDAMTCLEMKWKNKRAEEKVGEEYGHDVNQWKRYKQMLSTDLKDLAVKLFS